MEREALRKMLADVEQTAARGRELPAEAENISKYRTADYQR
jgi:hypothetical protein